jgi:hypothetical protein
LVDVDTPRFRVRRAATRAVRVTERWLQGIIEKRP